MNTMPEIDKSWTLFLDRDGVINHEKKEDYVLNWSEFTFYDGVTDALKTLSNLFGTIVMVTNQRGVGKGLMTANDLADIHKNMVEVITNNDGRLDKIYYCDSMDNDCYDRKPNPGMAYQAQQDFKHIDFSKSVMVGNKLSDMQFGKNAGMFTVYVDTTNPEVPSPNPLIDFRFKDLPAFAWSVQSVIKKP
ncbi:D-glycero-alpha-D-manno-heptose-1,7-bisphosphate 7-phosphatase [Segetibacter aerophilus]|uniref:D,D-heptose 1,7-bisphosphate phosphatase n=2 Tax=Segetibacter aerophilus TaxID=670293 RepID=A0A512BDL0_9BACT|nr:D-glycero-alpha-D-manno-heptose-1,7-bisphosphate 7-phosphatase [Segetibacter aerophilus]